ncbi:MAG: hypothetical protein JNJ59_28380 [Deltaproteobacteria bacterium]|nr:hypothetical protein [Deltaproteobacteria bacterium]
MDLFSGDRGLAQDKAATPAGKIERALEEAIAARQAGRPDEAADKMRAAMGWLDAGSVRRELRVAVPRELGLAEALLGQAPKAREALLLALEQAAHDPVHSDPVRAALATIELMVGSPERAKQMLEGRGRNRRAALSALARIHLYEGQVQAAEQALQEADQAPGGTTATGVLLPPATVLRCFGAVWGQRPEQARMLYDGVSTRDNPMWELVRVALLRALWVQGGDGRYLQLALGTAEQIRFGEAPVGAPGFMAAVLSMHAATLALTGEMSLAVEAAHEAIALIGARGELMLPEWPRPAILCDLAMVYRDAGDTQAHQKVIALWDPLAWQSWSERMLLVGGPRMRGVTALEEASAIHDPGHGDFQALAVRLLEDPKAARLMALRALGAAAMAFGVEWIDGEGKLVGRIGAKAPSESDAEVERVPLPGGGQLGFYKAQKDALRALDRSALEALARVVEVREGEAKRIATLEDALVTADAARKLAEERLEQVRRPGTDKGHGGRFPTVVGRSDKLRQVLDRLGSLALAATHVVFDGAPGAGRRHLAQALFLADSDDPTGSTRAPGLEVALVEDADQIAALERLEKLARGGLAIVIGAHALGPDAASWLLDRMSAPRPEGARWALTLDSRELGPTAEALRKAAVVVRVPGLDERMEDLPLLIDHFAREAGKRPDDLSTATRALLARRAWPGQMAELRATLRAAAGRAGTGLIQPEHFERPQVTTQATGEDPLALGLREAVRTFQKDLVQRALEATAGHLPRAADLLGVPRAQLEKLARDLEVGLGDDLAG